MSMAHQQHSFNAKHLAEAAQQALVDQASANGKPFGPVTQRWADVEQFEDNTWGFRVPDAETADFLTPADRAVFGLSHAPRVTGFKNKKPSKGNL